MVNFDDVNYNTDRSPDGWIQKRFNRIIKEFPTGFFKNKTILELGCLCGDIGNLFSEMGAILLCGDGREDNLQVTNARYPHLKTFQHDFNNGLGVDGQFDVIIHFGLLYHLENPVQSIIDVCGRTNIVLLETEVVDGTDDSVKVRHTELATPHQSLSGIGIRITPSLIEKTLTECGMTFTRIYDGLDAEGHEYSWISQNNNTTRLNASRAFWVCKKLLNDNI